MYSKTSMHHKFRIKTIQICAKQKVYKWFASLLLFFVLFFQNCHVSGGVFFVLKWKANKLVALVVKNVLFFMKTSKNFANEQKFIKNDM